VERSSPSDILSAATHEWAVRLLYRQGVLRREITASPPLDADEGAALDACLRSALALPRPHSLASLAALTRAGIQTATGCRPV
jgi:hypothetical protein